jgi:receptor protein-tyrosine kinase
MALSRLKRKGEKEMNTEMKETAISGSLVTVLDPDSVASEAYRTLRTSLIYALVDPPPRVIVVTSPGTAEGKSTVCANLGVVLAQAGKSTLIIDCDFRKPVIHKIFGLNNTRGITDVLLREQSLQTIYQEPLPSVDLKVLSVGPIPPDPAELLSSRRLSEPLASVREQFDYVLIDSSPMGLVSDPTILATQADGVLLTLDAQRTRKGDVRQAVRSLRAVGANVLGTVMNNARVSKGGYY